MGKLLFLARNDTQNFNTQICDRSRGKLTNIYQMRPFEAGYLLLASGVWAASRAEDATDDNNSSVVETDVSRYHLNALSVS